MKSNGGVLSADEVVHQPITTVLSGPAAGALGAAVVARAAGFDRIVTCDGGGTSTDVTVVIDGEPALTTEGTVGAYPSKIPMIDVVTVGAGGGSIAWISPEGTLKVGPQSAGADPGPMCYGAGGDEPTITDAHLVLGRIPPHLLGGEVPLDPRPRARRRREDRRPPRTRCRAGGSGNPRDLCLEPGERPAPDHRQARPRHPRLPPRDVRRLRLAACLPAGRHPRYCVASSCRVNPGNLSAYGLLTVDVRNDYVRTAVMRHSRLDVDHLQSLFVELTRSADAALAREGFDEQERVFEVSADLRYFGQAYEVRIPWGADHVSAETAERVVDAFHDEHRRLYGYDFRDDPRQEVEWVNLRVTGVGPIRKPELRRIPVSDGEGVFDARTGARRVFFDTWSDATTYDRSKLGDGDLVTGPAVIEEFSSTIPVHPGFVATVDSFGNIDASRSADDSRDPILVEIVEGYLASVEMEVETAIGRTSRSPMIRDAHDYRAGIHDRRLRKLTGRSYSALVHPVVRDYPIDTMRPGDMFFHNDVYLSEGGIGHLPDLCVTAPVFARRTGER